MPESGRVMPIIMRMELDLPLPFGPSRPEHRSRFNGERKAFDRDFGVVDLANIIRVRRWAC